MARRFGFGHAADAVGTITKLSDDISLWQGLAAVLTADRERTGR